MATLSNLFLPTPKLLARSSLDSLRPTNFPISTRHWAGSVRTRPIKAAPDGLSKKVEESIKNAKEACSDDPVSGECVAAWDEVEELSAAASHARDKKKKESDPLETYCEDNPETDECRTYDN